MPARRCANFIEKIELSDYLQILKGSVIRTGCPNSGKSSLGCAIARILKCKKSPDRGNIWKFVSDTQPKFQFFSVAMVDAGVFGRLPTLPPPPVVDSGSDDTSLLDVQDSGHGNAIHIPAYEGQPHRQEALP